MNYSLGNMLSSGGRVAFNPLSLSPALWLSDTGSNPAQWDDLSGNGRHATQAIGANQPAIVTGALNGRQVRRFDGVDDRMIHGLNGSLTSCTIFAVFKKITEQTFYRGIIGIGPSNSSGSSMLARVGNNKWGTFTTTDARANSDTGTTNFGIYAIIDNAASGGSFFLNGSADGTYSGNTVGQLTANVGGQDISQAYNGDIAEILVFSRALSTTERQAVERYLSNKYAITIA